MQTIKLLSNPCVCKQLHICQVFLKGPPSLKPCKQLPHVPSILIGSSSRQDQSTCSTLTLLSSLSLIVSAFLSVLSILSCTSLQLHLFSPSHSLQSFSLCSPERGVGKGTLAHRGMSIGTPFVLCVCYYVSQCVCMSVCLIVCKKLADQECHLSPSLWWPFWHAAGKVPLHAHTHAFQACMMAQENPILKP